MTVNDEQPSLTACVPIRPAEFDDLGEILDLQYLAYQSEAELLGDYSIPPLRETLEEVRQQHRNGVILKAVNDKGAIIGSVRGAARDGTLYIGKLMVHPELRGKGLGGRLLLEIERRRPERRFELFTSDRSARNISLYERNGYRRFKEQQVRPGLRFVYLEKAGAASRVDLAEEFPS